MRRVAAVTLILFAAGCVGKTIPRAEIEENPSAVLSKDDRIASVVLLSDSTVTFDGNGGTYTSFYNQIHGTSKEGNWVKIPIEDVVQVTLKGSDGSTVVLIILGAVALVALLWWAASKLDETPGTVTVNGQ